MCQVPTMENNESQMVSRVKWVDLVKGWVVQYSWINSKGTDVMNIAINTTFS